MDDKREKQMDDTVQKKLEELHVVLYDMLKDIDDVCQKHGIQYSLAFGSVLGAVRHQGIIPWDDDLDVLMMRDQYEQFLDIAKNEFNNEKYTFQKELSDNWKMPFSKIRLNGTAFIEADFEAPSVNQGVFIDIFPIDNLSDNRLIQNIQFAFSRLLLRKCMIMRGAPASKNLLSLNTISRLLPTAFLSKMCKSNQSYSKRVHCYYLGNLSRAKTVYPRRCFNSFIRHKFGPSSNPIPAGWDEYLKILYGDYMTPPPEDKRFTAVHAKVFDLHKSYLYYVNK